MKKIAFYIILFFFFFSPSIYSQNSHNQIKANLLDKEILTFQSSKEFKNASLGFYVVDIKTGEEIAALNSDLALQPGSTMKLVTTAAALEILGSNFRFNTTLEYDGYIDQAKHVLNGNIYIKGGGDPTVGSRFFWDSMYVNRWVNAIKNAGIQSVNGCIIGDATIYSFDILPQTWSWEDMGNYFGAGACGLSVLDNSYNIYFRTGRNVGDSTYITEIKPLIPGLDFDNTVKSSNTYEDESYIFGAPYTYFRTIRGELPKGQESFVVKGSVPDPPLLAAFDLQMALITDGIRVARP
jgi:serine-type D-Ala-D-Ala carboxypeptidase/endopeptidase (penicillin-binding protein 4)